MDVKEVRQKHGALIGEGVGSEPGLLTFSISLEGLEGTGKTRFGLLTCPTPIVHINFGDREATIFLYEMSPERRAKTVLYSFAPKQPSGWQLEEAKESLFALSDIAKSELGEGRMKGGTFILDSGSSWWDAVQQVYVAPLEEAREKEGKKQIGGLVYQQGNLIVSGVISWVKNQGCFFIITHQKRQKWDREGPVPGAFDPRINSKVPFLVEVRLDLRKECVVCPGHNQECRAAGHVGRLHIAKLIKFRDTSLEGIELQDKAIDFSGVYKLYCGREFPNKESLL